MSVSPVSQRPAPAQAQPPREPVKAVAKKTADAPRPDPKPIHQNEHAQPTYTRVKEKQESQVQAKGRQVDLKA
ncbi:MAG: hypothetical protein WCL01_04560 [Comamonadaceae bacterium]